MKAGDLILIKSRGTRGRINRSAQTVITFKRAKFTHVQLCVAPYVVIDATPEHGVTLRNVAREAISEHLTDRMCAAGEMCVLRPPDGLWDPNSGDALVSAMVHMGKDYNWWFLFPQSSDVAPTSDKTQSAFCSELVTILLKQWGVLPQKWRRSSKVLPLHLAQLAATWQDVTLEWSGELKTIREWAESPQPEACKKAGLSMYPGNQQIQLLGSLKQWEVMPKGVKPVTLHDFDIAMERFWRSTAR